MYGIFHFDTLVTALTDIVSFGGILSPAGIKHYYLLFYVPFIQVSESNRIKHFHNFSLNVIFTEIVIESVYSLAVVFVCQAVR
jgi:hypothetical protein